MHIHLEPVGGIAGDMFSAALLDAFPQFEAELMRDLREAGLLDNVQIAVWPYRDHALSGRRFQVRATQSGEREHRSYTELYRILTESKLKDAVKAMTLDMFHRLALAESRAHGIEPESVHFHEVGGWDSIIDVTCAAWFIQRLQPVSFSVSPIPIGSGRIKTAHGILPVPAPASVSLLEGLPVFDDGIAGERVTPTGAVILQTLAPGTLSGRSAMVLRGHGIGFGSKKMPTISNMLRVLVLEPNPISVSNAILSDQVLVCEFEIDDQTAEDLAVGLARLQALETVLDVAQWPVAGKKGRIAAHVQVLAEAQAREQVIAACLNETSTLGVRWRLCDRALLQRDSGLVDVGSKKVRFKRVIRPSGQVSVKAEMDDISTHGHDRATREALRVDAERLAVQGTRSTTGSDGQQPAESRLDDPATNSRVAGHSDKTRADAHHHGHEHHGQEHHGQDGHGGHTHPVDGALGSERIYGGRDKDKNED